MVNISSPGHTRFSGNLRMVIHGKPVTKEHQAYEAIGLIQRALSFQRTDVTEHAPKAIWQRVTDNAGNTEVRVVSGHSASSNNAIEAALNRPAEGDLDIAKLLHPDILAQLLK